MKLYTKYMRRVVLCTQRERPIHYNKIEFGQCDDDDKRCDEIERQNRQTNALHYKKKQSSTGKWTTRTCVALECLNFLIGKSLPKILIYMSRFVRTSLLTYMRYVWFFVLFYNFAIRNKSQVDVAMACASCICACVRARTVLLFWTNESVCRRSNENSAEFYWCETHILGGFSFVYVSMTNARSLSHTNSQSYA